MPAMIPILLAAIAAGACRPAGADDPWAATPEALPPATIRFDGEQSPDDLRPLAGSAGWDRFIADSVNAPQTVVIEPVPGDGPRVGYRIRAAFTVHAPVERLRNDETLRRSLVARDDADGSVARPLSDDELSEAGIAPPADEGGRPVFLDLLILNRVRVRGVVSAETTEHPDGVEIAWRFDPRFGDHPRWRPTWARLEETDLGTRVEGMPQPYGGACGSVAVRTLASAGDPDLVVIESRMVVGEPEGWFKGANVLRAKIPLVTQDGVRTLRRRLAAAR